MSANMKLNFDMEEDVNSLVSVTKHTVILRVCTCPASLRSVAGRLE